MGVLIRLTLAFILMGGGIREYERASLRCERHFTCHSLYIIATKAYMASCSADACYQAMELNCEEQSRLWLMGGLR